MGLFRTAGLSTSYVIWCTYSSCIPKIYSYRAGCFPKKSIIEFSYFRRHRSKDRLSNR